MKSYTVAEFKTHSSKILSAASKQREEALITRHGKPLALIVPVNEADVEWSMTPAVRERLGKAFAEKLEGKVVRPGKGSSAD